MCGILGIKSTQKSIDDRIATSMLFTLHHRGKDNETIQMLNNQTVALGHTRLSLIDLSEHGNQPMCNENKTVWLSFNGEIYNFKELKTQLEQNGHLFKSKSDAEVVLHGYEQWGISVLQKLNGMFAFVIYDENKQQFFCARDRFGIKPLYYALFNSYFIASSEIKAILKHPEFSKEINTTSFSEYFTYRYIPSPNTIYKNIYKLPPASYLIADKNNSLNVYEYWQLVADEQKFNGDINQEIYQRLKTSVKEHLQSDVPVGIFLSSGLDSSTIAMLTKENHYNPYAFTIGFENWEKSEHQQAQIIAQQLNISEFHQKILRNYSIQNIHESVYHYDEPIADISIVPTYEISRFAATKVRTVLSGEGGDELFAGYHWHKTYMMNRWAYQGLSMIKKDTLVEYYAQAMAMGLFNRSELKKLLPTSLYPDIPDDVFHFYRKHYIKEIHPLKALQYLDLKTFLAELVLTKVDRASMAHTLEVRVPFLDKSLVEFMFSLHPQVYFRKHQQKYLLQHILKSKIPTSILNKPKQGFVGPDSFYSQNLLYSQHLKKSNLAQNGLLCQQIINQYIHNGEIWKLWKILIMENWFNYWILGKINHE